MSPRLKKTLLAMAALTASVSASAVGITVDQMGLTDAQKEAITRLTNKPAQAALVSPGVALGSPVAFGMGWGQAAVGVGGQTLPKSAQDDYDGSMSVAMGLGDADNLVGLEVAANIISLRNDFAEDGSFTFKLHKKLDASTAVAIGTEGQLGWGAARRFEESYYGAVTKVVAGPADMPLVVNLGAGNHRFRSTNSTIDSDKIGVFGGFALVPTDQLSFIVDYTGVDLNAGVSVVPVRSLPITVTLGAVAINESQNRSAEFTGAVGYAIRF